MSLREFYVERRRAEGPAFLRVLQALPADRLDYKPHERSPSAQQIAWTLTKELGNCVDVVTDFKTTSRQDPAPPLPEMLQMFEQWATTLVDRAARLSDEEWHRTAHFYHKGNLVNEQPVGQFLWFIHFDAIHHRGQLSTYLRPMGATVPSIYGPSADSRAG
jgi:uncharacterized damage-inducible protein DinB